MSEFQIFSDGAADIPSNIKKQYNIITIPFYISLDQKTYQKEIEELPLSVFYNNMIQKNVFPKTSLPSVQDYIDAFTPLLESGKDIICFTITDTLSGSFQSAMSAKQILEENYTKRKIYIENSYAATGSQYLIVREAARMQQLGYDIDIVHSFVQKAKIDSRIFFVVGTLTHLEKGGRIGKVAALSGSILNIKPLIVLANGEINKAGLARSRKKAMLKLSELTKNYMEQNHFSPSDFTLTIGTTNTPDEVDILTEILKSDLPNIEIIEPFQIGATIATHTGPMTLGVCINKKFECYL
ncbi:DegV family protein [Lachnospiraceae bacterium 46-61]